MSDVSRETSSGGGASDLHVSRETWIDPVRTLDEGSQTGEDGRRVENPWNDHLMAIWRRNKDGGFTQDSGNEAESSVDEQDPKRADAQGVEVSPPAESSDHDPEAPTTSEGAEPIQASPEAPDADQEQVDDQDLDEADDLDDEAVGDVVAPVDPLYTRPVRALPRVIAIANQKGGVGKTTTTINLGAGLAELGYRVLVIDLDPQGNATTGLGIERKNFEHSMYDVIMREQPLEDCIEPTSVKNLFVAPATLDLSGVEIELVPAFSRELRLKRALDPILEEFDFVMIDCPPSLGLITINALAAAHEVLVPIQCEYYALEGLSQLRSTLKLVGGNLNQDLELSTIVLTMYDARTRLAADVAADVAEHFPDEVCRTIIPRTVRLSEAPSFGQPITTFDPSSRGAQAYRDLAKEVSNGAQKRTG